MAPDATGRVTRAGAARRGTRAGADPCGRRARLAGVARDPGQGFPHRLNASSARAAWRPCTVAAVAGLPVVAETGTRVRTVPADYLTNAPRGDPPGAPPRWATSVNDTSLPVEPNPADDLADRRALAVHQERCPVEPTRGDHRTDRQHRQQADRDRKFRGGHGHHPES